MTDQGGIRPKRGVEDRVFGELNPLPKFLLPLNRDIGRALALKKSESKKELRGLSDNGLIEDLADEVKDIYDRASVPCYSKPIIVKKIKSLWQKRHEMLVDRFGNTNKGGKGSKNKRGKKKIRVGEILDKLFDVVIDDEVPDIEKDFVEDQRSARKMMIGTVDKNTTKKTLKPLKQDKKHNNRLLDYRRESRIGVRKGI